MKSISLKYKRLLPALCCLFLSINSFGQETKQDTIALIQNYRAKASDALKIQDFETAIVNINRANKVLSTSSNSALKAEILLEAAELNYLLNNYAKGASEAETAVEILLETPTEEELLAAAYYQYGLLLIGTGDYVNSEKYLHEADKIFTKRGDEKNQANVVLGLGIRALKTKRFKIALNYFDAAIPLFQTYKLQRSEAISHLNKAHALLYLQEGEVNYNPIEQAKLSLNKAIVLSKENSYEKIRIDCFKIAAFIAIKENNFDAAEDNLRRYESRGDSLLQIYIKAISKGVEVENNIGESNEIIALKDDLSKKQKSIDFGKMTTALSIALIVILSLLTLSLYKNNNLRAKANELLQDKNNELLLAKEKAEKASLAKAQFLSTITHELRTPLYAVTGLTHLLMEEDPLPHQKEHLNSLKFSGEYLLSLINNILDLNKLEANKVEVEKTSFSLKKRLNDVLIALKKSADDRNNNLHLEFDNDIPEQLVGDPLKLSQVLINLVGNSMKFTQNGDVYVRIKKLNQTGNKISLHFEIEDNGVGISKKKQKSIFETFSQASVQINRKFGGTGLGLSIVKNLLELMGSKIHLESQLGQGSKFWFDINFDISEEINGPANPKNIIYDVDYVALENRKVLVVEDNKINQMITKKILEKNKMICMVADNGMEAIELVKQNTFDIILMDIHMPGISGIEATQKIREFNKSLPIIALTAVTIDENLDDFYRAGFNEIIPKPFKTEEFFSKIYRTLEGRATPVDS